MEQPTETITTTGGPDNDEGMEEFDLHEVRCGTSGESFKVRVPKRARHHWITWGDKPRVVWTVNGEEHSGVEVSRGRGGITVVDHNERIHRLPHGAFRIRDHKPREKLWKAGRRYLRLLKGHTVDDDGRLVPLRKAEAEGEGDKPKKKYEPLKPGERWITVHPWGDDERGVPVLISPNPDGTHSVIGGAGGKLNHLRLKNVQPPTEENKKKWAEKSKEREAKHKERVAEAERKAEADAAIAAERKAQRARVKQEAEEARDRRRKLIADVREKLGGVDNDLDEEAMRAQGMTDGEINTAIARHERQQYSQVKARLKVLRNQLAEDDVEERVSDARIDAEAERTNADSAAREAAKEDATQEAADHKEREAERARAQAGRRDPEAKERAAEEAFQAASDQDAQAAWDEAHKAGGWEPHVKDDVEGQTASEEADRERLAAIADATLLASLVNGESLSDEQVSHLMHMAEVDRWAIKPEEIQALAQGTADERAIRLAKHEIQRQLRNAKKYNARANKFRKMEEDGQIAQAWNQLAFIRLQRTTNRKLRAATAKGTLDPGDRVPLTHAEAEEVTQLLGDQTEMRRAERRVSRLRRLVEEGQYDRSRREFDLKAEEVSEDEVRQSIEEQQQTDLARQVRGFVSPSSSNYLESVASGHYNGLADASLSIAAERAVTREAMDAIGVKNAAILARFAIEESGHDPTQVLEALERHHVKDQLERSSKALARVAEVAPDLLTKVRDVDDLETALQQVDVSDHDLAKVEKAIGSALGYMEAMATLGQVFRGGEVPEHLTVPLNDDVDGTIKWLQSVGLRSEDYDLVMPRKGHPGQAIIPRDAWRHMLREVTPAARQQREQVQAIRHGEEDQDGWIPAGFPVSDVADAGPPRKARISPLPDVWRPARDGAGAKRSLRKHVRSRLVEGENPWQIRLDLLSQDRLEGMTDSDRKAHLDMVESIMPLTKITVDGKRMTASQAADAVKKWRTQANAALARGEEPPPKPNVRTEAIPDSKLGDWRKEEIRKQVRGKAEGLHGQEIEALHPQVLHAVDQVLTGKKVARTAMKNLEDLDGEDMNALRDYFEATHGADESSLDYTIYAAQRAGLGPEPPQGTQHHEDWKARKATLEAQWPNYADDDDSRWPAFVRAMGGENAAYRALHAAARGEVLRDLHRRLPGRAGMVTGQAMIPGAHTYVDHLGTRDQRERFTEQTSAMQRAIEGYMAEEGYQQPDDLSGSIVSGEYADRVAELQRIPVFAAEGAPDTGAVGLPGQRFTLGSRVEQQLQYAAQEVLRRKEKGVTLPPPSPISMSGKRVIQQRAVKTANTLKRMALIAGTGTGKTAISIGAATEALERGETQKALFLSPAPITSQLAEEMHKFTEPGKYQWGASSDADASGHKSRMDLLSDPSKQFAFVTYESFRSTAVRAIADNQGITPEQAAAKIRAAGTEEVSKWLRDAFDAAGIPRPMIYADEIHKVNARAGASESLLSKIVTAAAHPRNSTHMVAGTATPIRNDISELASMAVMLRPDRYPDRETFMRQFGQNTRFNADALRRELGLFSYQASISPSGIKRLDVSNPTVSSEGGKEVSGDPLKLSTWQIQERDRIMGAFNTTKRLMDAHRRRIARWRERNKVATQAGMEREPKPKLPEDERDQLVAAMQVLSRNYDGNPDKVLRVARSAALLRRNNIARIIHEAPFEHNPKAQAVVDKIQRDWRSQWTDKYGKVHQGKPSLVSCDRLAPLKMLEEQLTKRGMKVATIKGGMSAQAREKIKADYEAGKIQVLLLSGAGEAGLNLQTARVHHHYDLPVTAKSLNQREGRAYRQGATGDVQIVRWLTDSDFDRRNSEILDNKAGLADELFGPRALAQDESGLAAEYDGVLRERGSSSRLRH